VLTRPGFSKGNFGSINPAKGFRLLQAAEESYGVTPRGLHLVQHVVDCLHNIVQLVLDGFRSRRGGACVDQPLNYLLQMILVQRRWPLVSHPWDGLAL
jgi:hypothetical protein